MEAKAAMKLTAEGGVEVHTIQVDEPGPGEVRVQLHACGLCHTDQSVLEGSLMFGGPIVLGHEGAGIVESVGPDVKSLQPGDHVVMTCTAFCGRCKWCVEGQYSQCADMPLNAARNGIIRTPFHLGDADLSAFASVGCLTEYTVVQERSAIKIPDDIPLPEAALLGCGVFTGVGAVWNKAKVNPGSTVAVWGAGGVGLNVIQGGAISGARTIICIDRVGEKAEFAKEFGATHSIDGSNADAVATVLELTDGIGVDYSFEAIGNAGAMSEAYTAIRQGGICTVVGVAPFTEILELPAGLIAIQEKTLQGTFYGGGAALRDYPRLIDLYKQGRLKLNPLITTTYSIEDSDKAYADMAAGRQAGRGVVLFQN